MARDYNNLQSTAGVQIEISYIPTVEIDGSFTIHNAADLHFDIGGMESASLGTDSHITLVLINRNSEQQQAVYQIKMVNPQTTMGQVWFSGDLFDVVTTFEVSEDGTPTFYYPQVAVVIDGVWQVDPVQPGEQHNFNFAWWLMIAN